MAWRGPAGPGWSVHEGLPGRLIGDVLAPRPAPESIVIGSVAGQAATADLRLACERVWPTLPVRELAAAAQACGVRNAYRRPERLGIDRWAAMIAAFVQHGGPLIVADCGTAITVDYVDGAGFHQGGMIAPGRDLMHASLRTGTRLHLSEPAAPVAGLLGKDTEDAVAAGVLCAMTGALTQADLLVSKQYGGTHVRLVTGGAAPVVRERLGTAWRYVPGLVLDGLALLADAVP